MPYIEQYFIQQAIAVAHNKIKPTKIHSAFKSRVGLGARQVLQNNRSPIICALQLLQAMRLVVFIGLPPNYGAINDGYGANR